MPASMVDPGGDVSWSLSSGFVGEFGQPIEPPPHDAGHPTGGSLSRGIGVLRRLVGTHDEVY